MTEQLTATTSALMMETIQGEGGLYPAEESFIKGVRQICDERDILLILDEIQCGMARSGAMFAWQNYGVKPDIMTCAKALGAGVPVGAFVVTDKVAEASLVPGDHGTTYGGNPLVCAAVDKTIDMMQERNLVGHVKDVSGYFEKTLDSFVEEYNFVEGRRGMGLMQGLVVSVPVGDIVRKALDAGLVVLSAGQNVVRFLPPLIIDEKNIDEMAEILHGVLNQWK